MSVANLCGRNSPVRPADAITGVFTARIHDCPMSTTLVLRLEHSKMSRLRDLVNDKADDLFSKLTRAESVKNAARVEGLTASLKFWDEIDRALRDAQPGPVASVPSPLCNAANDLLAALNGLLKHFDGAQSVAGQSGLNASCYLAEVEAARAAISKASAK